MSRASRSTTVIVVSVFVALLPTTAATMSLDASPLIVKTGQSCWFTVVVFGAGGSLGAQGNVCFYDGDSLMKQCGDPTNLGCPELRSGPASGPAATGCFASFSTLGKHTITAKYSGSSLYGPMQSSVTIDVVALGSSTVLTSSARSVVYGQPVTLTAVVTPESGGTPTGWVRFAAKGWSDTRTLVNGVATTTTSTLSGRYCTINAEYGGDTQYGASKSSVSVTIEQAQSQITLTSTPSPARTGQPVTVTATITGAPAAGSVSFTTSNPLKDASFDTVLCSNAWLTNNTASCVFTPFRQGVLGVTATYAGNINVAAATSTLPLAVVSDDGAPVPTLSPGALILLVALLSAAAVFGRITPPR